jgi:hypothetical protein
MAAPMPFDATVIIAALPVGFFEFVDSLAPFTRLFI